MDPTSTTTTLHGVTVINSEGTCATFQTSPEGGIHITVQRRTREASQPSIQSLNQSPSLSVSGQTAHSRIPTGINDRKAGEQKIRPGQENPQQPAPTPTSTSVTLPHSIFAPGSIVCFGPTTIYRH